MEEQTKNNPEIVKNGVWPRGLIILGRTIIIVFLNIAVTTASLFVYHNYILKPQQSQNIVGVDVKGFLEKQKAGMVNGKISEEQFKANMDKLEVMINDLGKRKVVLMSDVILRGAEIVDTQ